MEKKIDMIKRRDMIYELMSQGWTERQIAKKMKMSNVRVHQILTKFKNELMSYQDPDPMRSIVVKLEEYGRIKARCNEAWELSKQSEHEESVFIGANGEEATKTTTRSRIPHIGYLHLVKSVLDSEREMLGLDVPKRQITDSPTTPQEAQHFLEFILPTVRDAAKLAQIEQPKLDPKQVEMLTNDLERQLIKPNTDSNEQKPNPIVIINPVGSIAKSPSLEEFVNPKPNGTH